MIGRFRPSVQRVIGVRRDLPFAIRDGGDIAIIVIAVGLGAEERIFSRPCPVHVVVCVDRLLALGIGHGQQIAVGVTEEGFSVQEIAQSDKLLQFARSA